MYKIWNSSKIIKGEKSIYQNFISDFMLHNFSAKKSFLIICWNKIRVNGIPIYNYVKTSIDMLILIVVIGWRQTRIIVSCVYLLSFAKTYLTHNDSRKPLLCSNKLSEIRLLEVVAIGHCYASMNKVGLLHKKKVKHNLFLSIFICLPLYFTSIFLHIMR